MKRSKARRRNEKKGIGIGKHRHSAVPRWTRAKWPATDISNNKRERESRRVHTEHLCIYLYISSFILIFKPTKSCKYNFWMKGTGKIIRQCWYTKTKLQYKSGQLVTHVQILPGPTGRTEIYLTTKGGLKTRNPLAKLLLIAFPNSQGSSQLSGLEEAKINCRVFSCASTWRRSYSLDSWAVLHNTPLGIQRHQDEIQNIWRPIWVKISRNPSPNEAACVILLSCECRNQPTPPSQVFKY